jgi:FAD/FMN-containing dehydrogenase
VHALFGDELMWHLEFIRGMDGALTCTALPLVRYSTEDRLNQIIATLRERGVRVNNPHVNTVEDGKFGGTLAPEAVAMKRRLDPGGLLNPGKLRSWGESALV